VNGVQVGIKLGGLRLLPTDWMAEEMLVGVIDSCRG